MAFMGVRQGRTETRLGILSGVRLRHRGLTRADFVETSGQRDCVALQTLRSRSQTGEKLREEARVVAPKRVKGLPSLGIRKLKILKSGIPPSRSPAPEAPVSNFKITDS